MKKPVYQSVLDINTKLESNEICIAKSVLIIGSVEDSKVCIRQLEKNKTKFIFAKECVDGTCEYPIVSFFEAKNDDYDLFVITEQKASVIKDILFEDVKISKDKIIYFWQLYYAGLPTMICDRIMLNPTCDNYNGVILGLSNVEVGIITNQLKDSFCNLAVSSQDIYYNYKTLEYCLNTYPKKLENLKYAIIDLHDYNYFNYDTSLSNTAVKYLGFGGYNLDAHNFANNKNFEEDFFECVDKVKNSKLDGTNESVIAQWKVNFADVYEIDNYKWFSSKYKELRDRKSIVTDQQILSYQYDRASVVQIFEKTIEENIRNLETIFSLLLKNNSNIKIYLTMLPKFIDVEIKDEAQLEKHRKNFLDIIENLKKKYEFEFLNFKELCDITYKRKCFYDANHLNYFGAMKITNELNKIIFK